MNLSERHVAYFSNTPVRIPISYDQDGEGIHTVSDDPNSAFKSGGMPYNYAQLFSYLIFKETLSKKSAIGLAGIVAGTLLLLF